MPRVKLEAFKEIDICDLDRDYYTSRGLSNVLHLSMSTLAEYRRKGIGPKYIAVGYRSYRYSKEEVLKFINERTRASTSATRNYDLEPQRQNRGISCSQFAKNF